MTATAAKEKQRLCTNCKNHGLRKVWKKHKRYCKYRDCPCAKCMKTAATRKNCAEQTAKRRARQEDEQREQELQLNPANFLEERSVPYPGPAADAAASVSTGLMSGSTTKASSSRTSEYDDSSSIDIGSVGIGGGGGGGSGGISGIGIGGGGVGIGGGGGGIGASLPSSRAPGNRFVDIDAGKQQ